MNIEETCIDGLFLIHGRRHQDHRGWFEVLLDFRGATNPFKEGTLLAHSWNEKVHTLRGLHLQRPTSPQWKFVTCIKGSAFDVVADARSNSPTFGKHDARVLSDQSPSGWLIAPGLAHGFLTLRRGTSMQYLLSAPEDPSAVGGVHFADPLFKISWPSQPAVISERDQGYSFLL